jgi:hypothetical protein
MSDYKQPKTITPEQELVMDQRAGEMIHELASTFPDARPIDVLNAFLREFNRAAAAHRRDELMSDRLREALEVYPEMHGFPRYEYEECAIVEAAARQVLDATEIRWCETHDNQGGSVNQHGEICSPRINCSIVPGRLILEDR